jgi:hypothetical protein
MPTDSTARRERPWRWLITALIIFVLILFGLAFWSEREDARTLTPEEMEGVEERFDGQV